MYMSDRDDATVDDDSRSNRAAESDQMGQAFKAVAASALRVIILLLGLLLLIFASGQAVGLDLLGELSEILDTDEVRWIIVAFFGLVLVFIAIRGFDR